MRRGAGSGVKNNAFVGWLVGFRFGIRGLGSLAQESTTRKLWAVMESKESLYLIGFSLSKDAVQRFILLLTTRWDN